MIAIPVTLDQATIDYLKEHKINRSSFMRQARKAHQEGKWEYNEL